MEEPAGGLSRRSMFGVAAILAAATVGLPACGESGIEQPAAGCGAPRSGHAVLGRVAGSASRARERLDLRPGHRYLRHQLPAAGGSRFRLHFPPGQTPPVSASWSLTAYDADSYLLDNPAGIDAVGHQLPVVPDPDGSVDLALQHDDPGPAVPRGNWLPIPESGRFSLPPAALRTQR